ncbi:hypothetical protein RJ639_020926 [Escallonia herrerae]|uniref:Uncharacterized protein n=1 Tax=Escallonia herrerae TaxID=1293975 RepID=A0AA88V7J6_9ASTE|nr:hypothetical protein RJ639_020926 [Escallonia herrerae]
MIAECCGGRFSGSVDSLSVAEEFWGGDEQDGGGVPGSATFPYLKRAERWCVSLCIKGSQGIHYALKDKALAALVIEDKKRQYAAAEKHLEDVLQSALATSE